MFLVSGAPKIESAAYALHDPVDDREVPRPAPCVVAALPRLNGSVIVWISSAEEFRPIINNRKGRAAIGDAYRDIDAPPFRNVGQSVADEVSDDGRESGGDDANVRFFRAREAEINRLRFRERNKVRHGRFRDGANVDRLARVRPSGSVSSVVEQLTKKMRGAAKSGLQFARASDPISLVWCILQILCLNRHGRNWSAQLVSGVRYEAALVIELIRKAPNEVVNGQNKRPQLIWKARVRKGRQIYIPIALQFFREARNRAKAIVNDECD